MLYFVVGVGGAIAGNYAVACFQGAAAQGAKQQGGNSAKFVVDLV